MLASIIQQFFVNFIRKYDEVVLLCNFCNFLKTFDREDRTGRIVWRIYNNHLCLWRDEMLNVFDLNIKLVFFQQRIGYCFGSAQLCTCLLYTSNKQSLPYAHAAGFAIFCAAKPASAGHHELRAKAVKEDDSVERIIYLSLIHI